MNASSQLPVRVALLVLAAFFVLSERSGFESILGAFAAGMVVGWRQSGAQEADITFVDFGETGDRLGRVGEGFGGDPLRR